MTGARFGKVCGDYPVFRGRLGHTTLAVYEWLARRALTDARKETLDRPIGRVVASQTRMAEELYLRPDTVSRHLRRLREHGRIVLWQPHVRGRNYLNESGWHGLAAEYVVVDLASEETLRRAAQRDEARAQQAAQRIGPVPGRSHSAPVRGADGRFRRSDRATTPATTEIANPAATEIANPVETRAYETLHVETPRSDTPGQGHGSFRDETSDVGNRRAWRALKETLDSLPSLKARIPDKRLSGMATALMHQSRGDEDRIRAYLEEWAYSIEDDDTLLYALESFQNALGLTDSEYWPLVVAT